LRIWCTLNINNLFLAKKKMKRKNIIFTSALVVLQLCCSSLWALPTTAYEAEMVVTGWLKADAKPLDTDLGREVVTVETFTDDYGEPVYYIVYLNPSGFVIVSADDLVEPIIGFADDGAYDPSLENPLGALVTKDLNGRMAVVRSTISPMAIVPNATVTETQSKWSYFISLAETSNEGFELMGTEPLSDSNLPSDVRVAPLVKTEWDQSYIICQRSTWPYGHENRAYYNYYTPPYGPGDSSNYPSGCVATAMAQLMHYYEYPNEPNDYDLNEFDGRKRFAIKVDGVEQTALLRGGDGNGGPYKWDWMVLDPNCSATLAQRQAIGALCYDAGISVNMQYSEGSSRTFLYMASNALKSTFKYSNAIIGYDPNINDDPWLNELIGMINPNLDAKKPVILGILGKDTRDDSDVGHAVLCDGYGYDTSSLYHHLNMAFSGQADCWYNLPNIDCNACSDQPYKFTVFDGCAYNIFKKSDTGEEIKGEIISGRVTDIWDNPISGATVTAHETFLPVLMPAPPNTSEPYSVTNSNGIYALVGVNSGTTYKVSVTKTGYDFTPQVVTTGTSTDGSDVSGNKWGIDFEGVLDFQPTSRPASATQCPPVNTQCPVWYTLCPPSTTICRNVVTQCSLFGTMCPVSTRCPVESTKCPVESTKCPVESTKCPTNFTSCPPTPTWCVVINTECVGYYTQCPPLYTLCPTEDTLCPPVSTRCPRIWPCDSGGTGNSVGEMRNSLSAGSCPAIEVPCPSVVPRQMPTETRQPVVQNIAWKTELED